MNTLPQELIDYILDYLHDDKESLLLCCTVSKSWLSPCSFHLFAALTVRLPFHDELQSSACTNSEPFIDSMLQISRIYQHIQCLNIVSREYGSARPFDIAVLKGFIQPLRRLKSLSLHGLNLYCTDNTPAIMPRMSLSRLVVEESRLSSDALARSARALRSNRPTTLTRVLSVDSPAPTPAPTPGPAALSLLIFPKTTHVRSLVYTSCSRAQLSALRVPLLAAISTRDSLSLKFMNLYLDDLHAVDEYLSVLGRGIAHLHIELPDRWFSWDPPETNVQRLMQHMHVPSFSHLTALRTLYIAIPIKMSPTAFHVNRFMWSYAINILLSLPSTHTLFMSSPVSPSTPSVWTSDLAPLEEEKMCPPLDLLRIQFGNPRWTALAELPYMLGVVDSLDWTRLDAVAQHLRLGRSSPVRAPMSEAGQRQSKKPLEIQIGCRPHRRADLRNAMLAEVSPSVGEIVGFCFADV
ncbi:hypothetical protein NM688_g4888 [Phlebia brevispora]|uniref:Uncharacterized protein n=1 Tax=Phlebia brevispora TaxID=194682 RepID=A0ACC1T1X1_9APHY|nr:hypothetical protein NM688_g4888 [Phlebia brevispora]